MKKFAKIFVSIMCMIALMTSSALAFSGITTTPTAPGSAATTASSIIGYIQWIGYAIAVGMLVYIGIKYVMASANEKADLKNSLIKYVIGSVLIVGGVTVAGWIFAIQV